MAWLMMDVAPIQEGNPQSFAWEKEVDLAAGGNSDSILIPDDVKSFSVTVSFAGGGTGKVQTTTDKVATVKAGTATWVDWDLGVVAATTQDNAQPVTAVRAVQVNPGTMKLTARAQ
jgi:hypothetical protein